MYVNQLDLRIAITLNIELQQNKRKAKGKKALNSPGRQLAGDLGKFLGLRANIGLKGRPLPPTHKLDGLRQAHHTSSRCHTYAKAVTVKA